MTTCAAAFEHTPQPTGIVAWQSWAASMWAQGSRQLRCPSCGRYAIWSGSKSAIQPEKAGGCLMALSQRRAKGAMSE